MIVVSCSLNDFKNIGDTDDIPRYMIITMMVITITNNDDNKSLLRTPTSQNVLYRRV